MDYTFHGVEVSLERMAKNFPGVLKALSDVASAAGITKLPFLALRRECLKIVILERSFLFFLSVGFASYHSHPFTGAEFRMPSQIRVTKQVLKKSVSVRLDENSGAMT
jgi:hypothetical protein